MEMEVVVPLPPADFNFDSGCSSPYMTAPSSPQRFGNFFFSAPTSPSRASAFYGDLNNLSLQDMIARNSASSVPLNSEERPGILKSKATDNGEINNGNDGGEDFEFNFSGQLERTSLSADELFDGGKIKPLKPLPVRLQVGTKVLSPRSPRSRISQAKRIVQEAQSPSEQNHFDPFAATTEEPRKKGEPNQRQGGEHEQKRGRERFSGRSSSSSSLHRGTRSLSPLRFSDDTVLEGDENSPEKIFSSTESNPKSSTSSPSSAHYSFLSSFSFSKGYRKWRLKDFLLFRSASEGRAAGKAPLLKKYEALSRTKLTEDVKNLSFRSTDSAGSVSSSRRRGRLSAHELHYTVNRAVSEEMRKKTFLPYKQGLLGCLGFNPGVHEFNRGFGC
ncbi:hypothetical protein I3760_06G144500 [Carya illinoinensis]|nr:hypothetical protein I3760_06G144500 [Carya illinoinensis]